MKMVKVLSLYEIVFGLGGTIMVLIFLGFPMFSMHVSVGYLLAFVLWLLFQVFAVISGVLLWKMKRAGKILSIILHAFQIPVFTITGIKYFISLGLSLTVYVGRTASEIAWGIRFIFAPQFWTEPIYSSVDPTFGLDSILGLNISAVALLILFKRVQIE